MRRISRFRVRIECTPRGANAPRSCYSASVCRRKAIFAMHIRTFTRAAGVSPPWVSKLRMQLQCDEFPGFAFASNAPHGGLTPSALVLRCGRLPVKSDFCDAHTHVHKSGGRQPAVVRDTDAAPQNRASFRDRRTHVYRSAVRQPAVDVGNTLAQIQARLFAEPATVYVRVAVAFAVIVTTGG
jgi:hypothetical protein